MLKPSAARVAAHWLRRRAKRSPNQSGSSALLKRQGLIPVDHMFGELLPHRRPIVMPGEELQDRQGKVWLFVGTDEDGKAILAKNQRELMRLSDELVERRLHTGNEIDDWLHRGTEDEDED